MQYKIDDFDGILIEIETIVNCALLKKIELIHSLLTPSIDSNFYLHFCRM